MSQFTGISGLSSAEVLALIARNQDGGTAGLYDSRTILNEHRPVCTKEYHLTGKYLDGADNPDVWYPIPAPTGSVVYSNRFLTLTSGTYEGAATRCVIDTTKFPMTGKFIEVTCRIGETVLGAGGVGRLISIGFQPAFSGVAGDNVSRAIFERDSNGIWFIKDRSSVSPDVSTLPLGRNLQSGDVVTVRLDRQEGSANIDIARFYVNGQKQYETLNVPIVDCYAGIGVFSGMNTTTASSISIDYFGCKFVP